MAARRPLSDEHHVLRYISATKRFVDEHGTRLGPGPASFVLREDDKGGLSVTEVEYYGPMSSASRRVAATAYRESLESKKIGAQAIFAWARVEKIRDASLSFNKKVRIVHDPVTGNPGHAEVRHFSDEDLELLEHFSSDVFKEYEIVADMNLPKR